LEYVIIRVQINHEGLKLNRTDTSVCGLC
jgi:hypothetical protein